jgi:hypothetical protein
MDRTVPKTGSEEIELFIRTYYSLLRSTHPIQIQTLTESHMGMESSLHIKARAAEPDVSALIYASLRLPPCILQTDLLVLGQSEEVFIAAGYRDVTTWTRVAARGRRRRMHFNDCDVLAVYIASLSDIDDLIPTLTAYQIEWNKVHLLLQVDPMRLFLLEEHGTLTEDDLDILARGLRLPLDDVRRCRRLGGTFHPHAASQAESPMHLSLQLLSGSLAHSARQPAAGGNTRSKCEEARNHLGQRPVYFVSSNVHALPNLLTGYAVRHVADSWAYLRESRHEGPAREYEFILTQQDVRNHNNLL